MAIVKDTTKNIIKSVDSSLSKLNEKQIETMIEWIIQAKKKRILIIGMGRSGLVGRSFAMRLMHIGFEIYVMGETINPAIGKDDLIIAISGSGSTKLVVTASQIAKDVKAKIIAITSYPKSDLGRIADHVVELSGRTKVAKETDYFLRQMIGAHEPIAPLGTLFEVSSLIFLDSIIVELMNRMGKTEDDLKSRHATIE